MTKRKSTAERQDDESDEWFYDLRALARHTQRAQTRIYALAIFVLFAFFLLAYRVETNSGRIANNQTKSCEADVVMVQKFNTLLNDFEDIERTNQFINDDLRNRRIRALERAVVDTPVCR